MDTSSDKPLNPGLLALKYLCRRYCLFVRFLDPLLNSIFNFVFSFRFRNALTELLHTVSGADMQISALA